MGGALAPYNPDLLRVTKGGLTPKEIEGLVSREAARLVAEPYRYIIKDADEQARDVDAAVMAGKP